MHSDNSLVKRRRQAILLLALANFGSSAAFAADRYWVGTDNFWDGPLWSNAPGGVASGSQPGVGDSVFIVGSTAMTVRRDSITPAVGGTGVADLRIDRSGAGEDILFFQSDANLFTAVSEEVGIAGNGGITQLGGTHTVSLALILGQYSTGAGRYTLDGGVLNAGQENIGLSGTGVFNQTSGVHNVSSSSGLVLGVNNTSHGTYNLSGGALTLTAGAMIVGSSGQGTFNHSSGSLTTNDLILGSFGGTGLYSMSNTATLNVSGSEFIGNFSASSFGQTGGTHTITASGTNGLFLAYFPSGSGTMTLSAGTLSVTNGTSYVGYDGSGTIDQSGGVTTVKNLNLGFNSGSRGNVLLSGSGIINVTGDETIGVRGAGIFDQSGGTHTVNGTLIIQSGTTVASSYRLTGGTLNAKTLNNGSFLLSGGTLAGSFTNDASLVLASGTITGSVVNLASASLTGPVQLSGSFSNLTGTAISGNGTLTIVPAGLFAGYGAISLSSLTNDGSISAQAGGLVINASNFTNNGALANSAGASVFVQTGSLINTGNITVSAGGTISFNQPLTNTSGRNIILSGGVLSSPLVTNSIGGTVAGFGQISGSFANSGTATLNGPTQLIGNLTNTANLTVRNSQFLVTGTAFNSGTIRAVSGGTVVFDAGLTGNPPSPAPFPGKPLPPSPLVGRTLVDPGGAVVTNFVRQNSVALNGNAGDPSTYGKLSIRRKSDGGDTSVVNSLAIQTTGGGAPLGRLDLADSAFIIDYDAVSPLQSVRSLIVSGYAGGTWAGNGITSSVAAGDVSKAIGYAEASEVLGAAGTTFQGESADATSVLFRYTLAGDATLDGVVDFNDLVKLAQNYNTTVSATTQSWWSRGDFNYDGIVDFNDLVKLAQNYNTAVPAGALPGSIPEFTSDFSSAWAAASVPEPASITLVGITATFFFIRPRRRNQT